MRIHDGTRARARHVGGQGHALPGGLLTDLVQNVRPRWRSGCDGAGDGRGGLENARVLVGEMLETFRFPLDGYQSGHALRPSLSQLQRAASSSRSSALRRIEFSGLRTSWATWAAMWAKADRLFPRCSRSTRAVSSSSARSPFRLPLGHEPSGLARAQAARGPRRARPAPGRPAAAPRWRWARRRLWPMSATAGGRTATGMPHAYTRNTRVGRRERVSRLRDQCSRADGLLGRGHGLLKEMLVPGIGFNFIRRTSRSIVAAQSSQFLDIHQAPGRSMVLALPPPPGASPSPGSTARQGRQGRIRVPAPSVRKVGAIRFPAWFSWCLLRPFGETGLVWILLR